MARSGTRISVRPPFARSRPIGSGGSVRDASTSREPAGRWRTSVVSTSTGPGPWSASTFSSTSTNGPRVASERATRARATALEPWRELVRAPWLRTAGGATSSSASSTPSASERASSWASARHPRERARVLVLPLAQQGGLAVSGGRDEHREPSVLVSQPRDELRAGNPAGGAAAWPGEGERGCRGRRRSRAHRARSHTSDPPRLRGAGQGRRPAFRAGCACTPAWGCAHPVRQLASPITPLTISAVPSAISPIVATRRP